MDRPLPDRVLQWIERVTQARLTYSQYGEDLIIDRALRDLRNTRPGYVDIGAHKPFEANNTALFYRRGLRGVCVEPDPDLAALIARARPRDRCLNAGVGSKPSGAADFYIMSVRALSTFSHERAQQLEASGECRIEKAISVPMVTLEEVLQSVGSCPDLLSIDAEDMDLEILSSVDYEKLRPRVICAETLTYSDQLAGEAKVNGIAELLVNAGYFVYADTRVNTIFVDNRAWDLALRR